MDASSLLYTVDSAEFGLGLTQPIILSNNAVGASGNKLPIANFTPLLYQGKTYSFVAGQVLNDQNQLEDVLAEPDFFDDVFDLIDASSAYMQPPNNIYQSLSSTNYKLITFFEKDGLKGISAAQALIINDVIDTGINATPTLARVTYIAEALQVMTNPSSVSGSLSANTKSSMPQIASVIESKTYKLPSPYFYSLITDCP